MILNSALETVEKGEGKKKQLKGIASVEVNKAEEQVKLMDKRMSLQKRKCAHSQKDVVSQSQEPVRWQKHAQ